MSNSNDDFLKNRQQKIKEYNKLLDTYNKIKKEMKKTLKDITLMSNIEKENVDPNNNKVKQNILTRYTINYFSLKLKLKYNKKLRHQCLKDIRQICNQFSNNI